MNNRHFVTTAIAALLIVGISISPAFGAAPTNDEFDAATMISSVPFSDTVDNSEATTSSPDDPLCIGDGRTVWYSFTPSEDVLVSVNTTGSSGDTLLSGYVSSEGDPILFECTLSGLSFDASAGTSYLFMVDSLGSPDGGTLVLNLEAFPLIDIEVSIDSNGKIEPKGRVVTIAGTVTCSQSVDIALTGVVNQGNPNRTKFAVESFSDSISCTSGELMTWSTSVVASPFRFKPGDASVFVEVTGCGVATCDQDIESRTVKLMK